MSRREIFRLTPLMLIGETKLVKLLVEWIIGYVIQVSSVLRRTSECDNF